MSFQSSLTVNSRELFNTRICKWWLFRVSFNWIDERKWLNQLTCYWIEYGNRSVARGPLLISIWCVHCSKPIVDLVWHWFADVYIGMLQTVMFITIIWQCYRTHRHPMKSTQFHVNNRQLNSRSWPFHPPLLLLLEFPGMVAGLQPLHFLLIRSVAIKRESCIEEDCTFHQSSSYTTQKWSNDVTSDVTGNLENCSTQYAQSTITSDAETVLPITKNANIYSIQRFELFNRLLQFYLSSWVLLVCLVHRANMISLEKVIACQVSC